MGYVLVLEVYSKFKMAGARDKIYPGVTKEILFTFHGNFLRPRNEKVSGVKKVLVERKDD